MLLLAVDPGVSGAVALLNRTGGIAFTAAMPTYKVLTNRRSKRGKKKGKRIERRVIDDEVLASQLRMWDEQNTIYHAVIERVSSRSEQGVIGVFTFGETFGMIKGMCAMLDVPYTNVAPVVWKRYFGLLKKEKKDSVRLCQSLFPELEMAGVQPSEGISEAVLIGLWYLEKRHDHNK